jgi:RHS repeat-associated protein
MQSDQPIGTMNAPMSAGGGSQWQAMLQAAGSLEAEVVSQYVWGARTGHRDELILRDRIAESSGSASVSSAPSLNERLWSLMDYYDPTSVVDTEGAVVERYRFSAFGLRTVLAPDFIPRAVSDYEWDFGFKGQFLDLDTGYYNYGYRDYSAELGRWLSRDPIGEQGGVNLYGMAGNDLVNRFDLLGLLQLTGQCEVVLFVGHNGDVSQDLAQWNQIHAFVKKKNPNDPSVASALSCAYLAGDNGADGIPGFVGSGNGLIGWGSDPGSMQVPNGGLTPNDDPQNGFDNDKESREAFGLLKLILTNYHAGLHTADDIVDKMTSASSNNTCCSMVTFKLVFSSDWRSSDANDPTKTFGGVNIRGAIDQLQRHPFASPNLSDLPGVPSLQWNDSNPPRIPSMPLEVQFSSSF